LMSPVTFFLGAMLHSYLSCATASV
jgi:hypothetical protein